MASRRKYRRKIRNKMRKSPIIIMLVILFAVIGILVWQFGGGQPNDKESDTIDTSPGNNEAGGEASFHIIDVGQGDAILVMTEYGNMLIDSGDLSNDSQKKLDDYLKAKNVTGFEYVVFTHTDADHIGSGDLVILNYDVNTVIMPDYQATTKVFERLVDAIEERNVDLILIGEDKEACEQPGYSFKLGPVINTVMAPTEDFNDANEMSVVIKSVYGETSIMLTGDAEHKSEEAMLKKYKNGELDCDILKAGHHGSSTSTTQEFFDAVSPEVVLISCGIGNKYGHPHKETMDKFTLAEVSIYRTDFDGSIVITTDGETYEITSEK